jgi:protein SCO1/2
MRHRLAAAAILGLLALCAACRRAETPGQDAAKRYPVTGVVRGVDSATGEITLEHEAIEGFMGAMTMSFPVRGPAGASSPAVGDRISATLVVEGGAYWLEGIAPAAAPPASPAPSSSSTITPRPNRGVPVGEAIPDFSLTDQTGRAVRLSELRGRPVAVTFLYTRCPIATACPMTTAKFSQLDRFLAEKGFGELLTITVDPEHDTPGVLRDYANKAGADRKRWKFLTGDPKAVADVAERFGVLYYPDKGQIVHTQAVAVVDPRGRLANIYYGEDWKAEDILRDMEKARNG